MRILKQFDIQMDPICPQQLIAQLKRIDILPRWIATKQIRNGINTRITCFGLSTLHIYHFSFFDPQIYILSLV